MAEAFATNETDPNYDSVDPHVLNYFLMTGVYGLVFLFPVIWAIIAMFTKGQVGSKVLVWFIHHWVSNMTLINMIITSAIFGALYLGSQKEIWYISAYLVFAVIGWVITMAISIRAIQFSEPGWFKVAPGFLWPSLFFIDNDLDGYLAAKEKVKEEKRRSQEELTPWEEVGVIDF